MYQKRQNNRKRQQKKISKEVRDNRIAITIEQQNKDNVKERDKNRATQNDICLPLSLQRKFNDSW